MRPPLRQSSLLPLLVVLCACGGNEYVEPPAPAVTVSTPEQRSVTEYLEFTGTAEAVAEVEIRARVKGFLQVMLFEEGTDVEQGALLYVIDPSEYEARVASAQAAVQVARATLALERAKLARLEQALKTNAVSEVEVLEGRARAEESRAMLEAKRADLTNAELDLSYTRVTAPMAGRVGRTEVDPGNLVGASDNTLLTTLVVYDPIYATFDVSERALLTLADANQEAQAADATHNIRELPIELARATDDGYPFPGHFQYADQQVDPDTGTFLIRGQFANPEPRRLIPGVFVRGRTPLREREGALLVPERAIGSDQRGDFVLVVDAQDMVEYRSVTKGTVIDGMAVIEKGVAADDLVIVNGMLRARPGAPVAPRREGEAEAVGSTATAASAD